MIPAYTIPIQMYGENFSPYLLKANFRLTPSNLGAPKIIVKNKIPYCFLFDLTLFFANLLMIALLLFDNIGITSFSYYFSVFNLNDSVRHLCNIGIMRYHNQCLLILPA